MLTHSPYPMIPVAEAQALLLERIEPVGTESLRFDQAAGRVLAEEIIATEPLPPFPASVVDGFAVRAAEGASERQIVGAQHAGEATDLVVGPGQAAQIMTGAPLPDGADAVMMVEFSVIEGNRVRFDRSVQAGDYLRAIGSDIQVGEQLLGVGDRIGPAEIGLLATVGALSVRLFRRPVVGVMSTGDELVEPSEQPGRGQIRDSNRYSLMAAVQEAGGQALDLGRAPDERAALERFVTEALPRCDALLTSGGVSMGTRDLVKPLLEQRGVVHFGRVNMKPGKPTTFGTLEGKPCFALPGNPVSSLVAFEQFVRPALRKMGGLPVGQWQRMTLRVRLAHPIQRDARRDEFQRVTLSVADGQPVARVSGAQGSSRLLSMVGANALIHLPRGREQYAAGDEVEALWLAG